MSQSAFNQILDPLTIGEDAAYELTGTFTSDPTNWAVQFTLIDSADTSLEVTNPTITRSVTNNGDGTFDATFTVPLGHADTVNLETGQAGWQMERTDTGSYWPLGDGTMEILEPRAPLGP